MMMKYAESKMGKTVFVRLSENEDLLEMTTQAATKAGITAGFFMLIGTLKVAKLGFFHEGKYKVIDMQQPLEIVSCLGNVSIREGKVFPHAHLVVSDDKGRAFGGHAMQGCLIGVTGELVLIETKGCTLFRKFDKKTNLSLLSFSKSILGVKKKRSA
jgi:predicted DNA-binding protein with PD1-like motif